MHTETTRHHLPTPHTSLPDKIPNLLPFSINVSKCAAAETETRKALTPPRDDIGSLSYLFTGYNLIRIGGFVFGGKEGASARRANAITSSRVCCVIRLVGYVFGRDPPLPPNTHTHTHIQEEDLSFFSEISKNSPPFLHLPSLLQHPPPLCHPLFFFLI